jgi:hypothetical protein
MTKLQAANVIEFRDGKPVFTRTFTLYIIVKLSDPSIKIGSLSAWRSLLADYAAALASLTIGEISDMLELMIFDFKADASRILAVLDEAGRKGSAN